MNGAESLLQTAVDNGVEICFTNPGTTEMHLVAALDSVSGMRGVLGLFEGVVTGAADGYGRMTEKPALTLLHLGPGFANGIANLHNARRAGTPIVNLIGHHATWQRNFDPPLNTDVEQLAGAVSAWQRTCATAGGLSRDMAEAISASKRHPGQIASLVVPADCQWNETAEVTTPCSRPVDSRVPTHAVESAARALRAEGSTILLLGGHGLREVGLRAAGRIKAATSCRLASETFPARLERGPHLPATWRLPYFPEQAADFFSDTTSVILAGAVDPVAFFGYQGGPSRLIPEGIEVHTLSHRDEDTADALASLAEALEAPESFETKTVSRPDPPRGPLDPESIAQALVCALPEHAIVVDEGVTSVGAFFTVSVSAPAHTLLNLTGGAIGFGMPCGVGAAIACPDRKVIVLEGDGSGLYTNQALWSQAREGLDVVNVVFSNNIYRILQIELHRAGVSEPGPQSLAVTELGKPAIDWHALGKSFGVPTHRATTAEQLFSSLRSALAAEGPQLVVVEL